MTLPALNMLKNTYKIILPVKPFLRGVLPFYICCSLFWACDSNQVFDQNLDIPKYTWNVKYEPEFHVTITDTTRLYNVYINIRHTRYYPYSNLWVNITTRFPDGLELQKRVELPLADKNGRWYGTCLGDICDLQVPIQERAYFNKTGEYMFRIKQIMRMDELPAVMSIGLRLETSGERPVN
ncbi:MAG: hypothetical protein KatS3mg031_1404 [Chitinophagales bacterium]|nr:MAG: hypothetical protein KatS3mg031_1404 [Chitinophagales bacterium]